MEIQTIPSSRAKWGNPVIHGTTVHHGEPRVFDDPNDIMTDDEEQLRLSHDRIDIVLAEVKTNEPCRLNGPWTRKDDQNLHRVLAAIGCLPPDRINQAAADIYEGGLHVSDLGHRVRLVAVGRVRNTELSATYAGVVQLIWPDMLLFVWNRLHRYRRQKTQVDQWDADGLLLKRLADDSNEPEQFAGRALDLMRVRNDDPPK